MATRPTSPTEPSNRLLDRLPEAMRQKLRPLLRPVELKLDQVLYEMGGPIDSAYFPAGAVLSALVVMQDGNLIEVATVGHEGVVGHYGSGGNSSPHRVVVQIGDGGHRIASRTLQGQASGDGPLKELLTAYHV